MRKIRRNVFETNSSSTHSITIIDATLEPSYMYISDDGYIYVELEECCSYADYCSQRSRLAIALQQLMYEEGLDFWYASDYDAELEKLYSNEKFQKFSDEIAEYVGEPCKGVRLAEGTEGYIDHESVYYSLDRFLSENGFSSLVDFVFSKGVNVHFEFNG